MKPPVRKKEYLRKTAAFVVVLMKWTILLAVIGIGGFFAYRWLNPPPPFLIGDRKPSQILQPIMSDNLPFLLGTLQAGKAIPRIDLEPVEKAIHVEMSKDAPLQAAWKIGSDLCNEIQTLDSERQIAAESYRSKNEDGMMKWWQGFRSKLETREIALRKIFYNIDPERRWAEFSQLKQEKIKKLYLAMLAAETPVEANAVVPPINPIRRVARQAAQAFDLSAL